MSAWRRKKSLRWRERLHKFTSDTYYRALSLVQVPFQWVFWRLEQAKARLQDKRANEDWET